MYALITFDDYYRKGKEDKETQRKERTARKTEVIRALLFRGEPQAMEIARGHGRYIIPDFVKNDERKMDVAKIEKYATDTLTAAREFIKDMERKTTFSDRTECKSLDITPELFVELEAHSVVKQKLTDQNVEKAKSTIVKIINSNHYSDDLKHHVVKLLSDYEDGDLMDISPNRWV